MSDNANDTRFEAMHEILVGILDRLSTIESLVKNGAPAASAANDSEAPTRRIKNERGDWVCDVTGLSTGTDKNTGEDGYWARSKKGKWYLVDTQGYPMFDEDRPLKREGTAV